MATQPDARFQWTRFQWVGALRRAVLAHWHALAAVSLLLGSMVLTAVAFPDTGAAGLATLGLVAAIGAAAVWLGARKTADAVPRWVWAALSYAIVLYVGHFIFKDIWAEPRMWKSNDWGTHHAIARTLIDGIAADRVPTWVPGLTTGEVPFDLYPAVPYYMIAWLGPLVGPVDDLPFVLPRLAIALHILTAIAATRLALRLVPWPLAIVAGLLMLFDRGAGGVTGGWMGVLYWGVFHSAVAQCLWLFALASVIDGMRRPRLGTTVLFWCLASFGTVAHPIGVIFAAATGLALAITAALARDLPARRALVWMVQVGLVAMVTAVAWMGLFERLALYGVHYGNDPVRIDDLFRRLATYWKPFSQLGAAVTVGMLGIGVGLFSRRAVPTFVAVLAGCLIVGASDQVYVLLHTGPSEQMARFSPERLLAIAKAPMFVCSVYLLARLGARLRTEWPGHWRLVGGAIAALLVFWLARGARPFVDEQIVKMHGAAEEQVDPENMELLLAWARERASEVGPGAYARLLQEPSKHELYHVYAETGLAVASTGGVANLFLRERIEDGSPASLKRFNVRWIIGYGKSPRLGDPASERQIGTFRIREVADWDGKFARVERGSGDPIVTQLDSDGVVVDLQHATEPALVALGTGYYPRWRARHEDGRAVPVYALPTRTGGQRHVVAAWLPPGRTTFTADGPLPSDGKGTLWTVLAGLCMIALTATWSTWRGRVPVLRRLARAKQWLRARPRPSARMSGLVAATAMGAVLVIAGARSSCAPDASIQVGSGVAGVAKVRARAPSERWRLCEFRRIEGVHRCATLLQVRDVIVGTIQDARQSWPYQTPGLRITTLEDTAEYRIRRRARLSGTYRVSSKGAPVKLTVDDQPAVNLDGKTELTFRGERAHTIVFRGKVTPKKPVEIAFVLKKTLDPERHYPTPPTEPPAALTR